MYTCIYMYNMLSNAYCNLCMYTYIHVHIYNNPKRVSLKLKLKPN